MKCRTGSGRISACGGDGYAGGGGGRVSVDVYSRHDDPKIFVHGETPCVCLTWLICIVISYKKIWTNLMFNSMFEIFLTCFLAFYNILSVVSLVL